MDDELDHLDERLHFHHYHHLLELCHVNLNHYQVFAHNHDFHNHQLYDNPTTCGYREHNKHKHSYGHVTHRNRLFVDF